MHMSKPIYWTELFQAGSSKYPNLTGPDPITFSVQSAILSVKIRVFCAQVKIEMAHEEKANVCSIFDVAQ